MSAPFGMEAQHLFAKEEQLAAGRLLLVAAATPSPSGRDLLKLAVTIQALQRRAIAEAARR